MDLLRSSGAILLPLSKFPLYPSPRFHVQRLDGSRAMFDFRDAFDDSYHNYKAAPPRSASRSPRGGLVEVSGTAPITSRCMSARARTEV